MHSSFARAQAFLPVKPPAPGRRRRRRRLVRNAARVSTGDVQNLSYYGRMLGKQRAFLLLLCAIGFSIREPA